MVDIRTREYRFGAVASAIGSNHKSLRHWIERGLVEITIPVEEKGRWQDFNLIDVFCLVLVRRLVDYGVPVKDANEISSHVISAGVSGPWNMDSEQFLAKFHGEWLIVRHIRPSEGEEGGWRGMEFTEGSMLQLSGDDAFIAIDLATLFHGAHERAVSGYDMPADMYLKPRRVVLSALDDAGPIKSNGEVT